MKNLLFVMLSSLLVFTGFSPMPNAENGKSLLATCHGNKPCNACKNCKYCTHCNSGGGSCGICSSSLRITPAKSLYKPKSSSSQCKGTTKKGARCKRMVKGGGYCWQHS